MSRLLDEIIAQRKNDTLEYQEYLKRIKELAELVSAPQKTNEYPESLDSAAKRALYDNLDANEILALALDNIIKATKLDGWRDGGIKERKLRIAVQNILKDDEKTDALMDIIKAQCDY